MKRLVISRYLSAVGELELGSLGDALCLCDWTASRRHDINIRRIRQRLDADCKEGTSDIIRLAVTQLDEYFSGNRHEFDVPLLFGGTPFQNRVWGELNAIPYGTAVTYGEVARRLGAPQAVRAVASAVAANPLSIIVPCHRVIGAGGRLTGYAGGIDAKRALLTLEHA